MGAFVTSILPPLEKPGRRNRSRHSLRSECCFSIPEDHTAPCPSSGVRIQDHAIARDARPESSALYSDFILFPFKSSGPPESKTTGENV
jgi:hypothetical protein